MQVVDSFGYGLARHDRTGGGIKRGGGLGREKADGEGEMGMYVVLFLRGRDLYHSVGLSGDIIVLLWVC